LNPVYSMDSILGLLDQLFEARQGEWWDAFFSDREKPCPFFIEYPDENLLQWVRSGDLKPGKALELGCGNGRNALFLAQNGYQVDAVDYSEKAISWAIENTHKADVEVNYICDSLFEVELLEDHYDFVYDCGCFHHIAPHRRQTYVELIARTIRAGGHFGLVCFAPEGGSGLSDLEMYQQQSLRGGIGYTKQHLLDIFAHRFKVELIRKMQEPKDDEATFGKDFLWVALMKSRKSGS